MTEITPLSIAAAAFYGLVALACFLAASVARRSANQNRNAGIWALVGAFFVLLVVWRVSGAEDILRGALRMLLREDGLLESRRSMQRVLVAGMVVLAGGSMFWWLYRTVRSVRGRRNLAPRIALFCCAAMLLLITVRLVSLHDIDTLLYGPLKLNWVADIGLSGLVIALAFFYVKLLKHSR